MGLSPRVRGIQRPGAASPLSRGSIPACTGNPVCRRCIIVFIRVYPRVYGESGESEGQPLRQQGLSPRVRGIPGRLVALPILSGSIPACTGNPSARYPPPLAGEVYPRVYGESAGRQARSRLLRGLSPRVRGIRRRATSRCTAPGSIPACTGNPNGHVEAVPQEKVYPRVYGESMTTCCSIRTGTGLSPRVRGIPRPHWPPRSQIGSIPACTGNPAAYRSMRAPAGVYPRVYGESSSPRVGPSSSGGLSPRVRGIRHLSRAE